MGCVRSDAALQRRVPAAAVVREVVAVGVVATLLMTASVGWTQQVSGLDVRSGRSLKDVPTQLRPAAAAPATRLSPVNAQGELDASSRQTSLQATSLGAAAQPQTTLLRQAEVPPQRLAITRSLLAELRARPTAQQGISIDLPADVL